MPDDVPNTQPATPDEVYDPAERDTQGERGAVALEWALLLGGIAIPAYFVLKLALAVLLGHYRMMTTFNSFPFP